MKGFFRTAGATFATVVIATTLLACTPSAPEPVSAEPTARTTPVPAPSAGTIEDVEETASASPVVDAALDDVAELGGGVTARIDEVDDISVKAETPGEIAGPAVAVHITIDNDGSAPIDISSAMVSLVGDGEVLGQPTTSQPYAPFSGTLAAGDSATGVYVFLLPEDARSAISVSVQYLASAKIALFADKS